MQEKESTENSTDSKPEMLELDTIKENPEHGPNESVSEQTELMGDYLGRNDHPDESKITPHSTATGTHGNGTRNDGSNSNQVGPKGSSSVRKKPGSCIDFCRNTLRRYSIIIAIFAILSFVASIGVLLAWQLSACAACPKYWLTYEGKCYNFSNAEGTWNSSQNNCTLYGASLVLVDTKEEMAFVKRYKGRTDYWIGLRKEAEGEPWKWANGSVFNNWFKIGANGLCAYLDDRNASSTWCHTRRSWICSKFLHAP